MFKNKQIFVLVIGTLSGQVLGSGFQLNEQNVTNLGTAYSGTAALAEDASTGFYNPAGLTRIPGGQVVIGGVLIQSNSNLTATSAISPTGAVLGLGEAHLGTVSGVPAFHIAQRLDGRWVFGFDLTSPFGESTRYNEDSIARYMATETEIITMDLGASIAYQIIPCFSIAAGPDALYTQANISARTRSIANAFTGSQTADGFQRNHADGWGWGWHLGMLWEPTSDTRVGVSYRSSFKARLDGNTEVLGLVSPPVPLGTGTQDNYLSRVRAEVTLPEVATLSVYHGLHFLADNLDERFDFLCNLAITGDIEWTNWSRIRTLRLRYHRPLPTAIPGALAPNLSQFALLTPDSDTPEHFSDSRRYALGAIYTIDDAWLIRVGVALDETPVRDEFRTARLPDADRYWFALGGAYTCGDWRFDLGYAYISLKDASLNERALFGGQSNIPLTSAVLSGDYKSSANLFGVQIRYDFV